MKTIAVPLVKLTLATFLFVSGWSPGAAEDNSNGEAETTTASRAAAENEAAEEAAREAEAALGPLRQAMQEADAAYAQASREARTKRRQATEAQDLAGEPGQADLERAEANLANRIEALSEAREAKPRAEEALAEARSAALPLQQAYDAAERAAQEAAVAARAAEDAANQRAREAERATARAAALRGAVRVAEAALARVRQLEPPAKARADRAAQTAEDAPRQKQAAEEALADVRKQIAAATAGRQAAEEVAQTAEEAAEEKRQAAAEDAAKRQAVATAREALAKARESEDEDEVAAAKEAYNQAREAAQELLELDEAARQAADEAAAKREAADEAWEALEPLQRQLEDAAIAANTAERDLTRAENLKNAAETERENLQQRIAEAKTTHVADEQAAEEAEAAAAPLREKAEEARAAFRAARSDAQEKRALAQQARITQHRLAAAQQAPQVKESSDPPKPANRIDEIVFARLDSLGIQPALCSDATFVRRAYLDVTGKLPTAEKARTFIQDANPNKRAELIDRLLDQYAHADYWSMRWSDVLRIKAEFPVTVWPNAAQAYHRWVWESIAQNKPYDQFARELLTSSGSNYRVGPVNFYRAIQEISPEDIAGAVALTLMGSRIHAWPDERRGGMATFFSQVGYKPTSEWKEEIVFWDPYNSVALPGNVAPGVDAVAESVTMTNQIPGALAEPLSPNEPLEAVFPDGDPITIPPDRDPREVFADWLIDAENPWFAKAVVNRIWAWIMGRGIIEEPDDIRDDNPPSNPELLAYLEQELIDSGYDLRHLKRLIFTSTTYQLSSLPSSETPEAAANFASYPMRRVEAEVLIDAVNRITGSTDLYTSAVPEPFTYIPSEMPAVALADGSVTSSFLTLFGRSARATGMQAERVSELAPPHWLHMLNSTTIQEKLANGPGLAAIIAAGDNHEEVAERLYLTILSRFPTETDLQAVEEYAQTGAVEGREMWIDLAWALINSPEFLLRH